MRQNLWISPYGKWLKKAKKIHRNPKTILRIMKKYELQSEIHRRRKWKQMGQQLHKYENLLNRKLQADRPNCKWVTDISYIHTGQGVLYLSVIRDLFDNSIVAYKTGTSQSVNLVLDTIRHAMQKEKKVAAELQLHSDQGSQYTSQALLLSGVAAYAVKLLELGVFLTLLVSACIFFFIYLMVLLLTKEETLLSICNQILCKLKRKGNT